MDNVFYATLGRQRGLMREMQAVANNLANVNTTGFRKESLLFTEHVKRLDDKGTILSMASANARRIHLDQGVTTMTGGTYDFAIEGDGFFLVETPDGQALTRAGSFTPNADGELMTPDGHRLLDDGGGAVAIPQGAGSVMLAADGTLSADGNPLGRVGVYAPTNNRNLSRQGGMLIVSPDGVEPVDEPKILQGYLEQSNVDPVSEVARMIEVQRAYEAGQSFLDREDERIRAVIRTLGNA